MCTSKFIVWIQFPSTPLGLKLNFYLCPSLATTIIGFLLNARFVDNGIALISIPKLIATHLNLALDFITC